MDHAARTGARLALLSNAPQALADAIERSAWAGGFERLFHNSRLGLMKHDSEVFTAVLDQLGAAPQDVLFIDDWAENTAAAAAMGIATITFTSSAGLAEALDQSSTASTNRQHRVFNGSELRRHASVPRQRRRGAHDASEQWFRSPAGDLSAWARRSMSR